MQCRTPEMVDVKSKRCACGKPQPSFGEAGGKAVCCKDCKTPAMVNVKNKHGLCGMRQPSVGEAKCKAVCCKQYKAPEVVDSTNKGVVGNRETGGSDCQQDTT